MLFMTNRHNTYWYKSHSVGSNWPETKALQSCKSRLQSEFTTKPLKLSRDHTGKPKTRHALPTRTVGIASSTGRPHVDERRGLVCFQICNLRDKTQPRVTAQSRGPTKPKGKRFIGHQRLNPKNRPSRGFLFTRLATAPDLSSDNLATAPPRTELSTRDLQ
ncbi:hypothetical protein F2Q70_00014321 [Brassica cretica]|uniref:Uncharacterized protein n=1 Tax=Brassica cretica TaxID=69181 RepID=A0A8S9I435_BRACR|nr:hypothetical protein F2Q70_00014321 [Brassica cretica]